MKYLPIFILVGGILIISLVGFIIFNQRSKEEVSEEEVVRELAIVERPFASLTPTKDGQELALFITSFPPNSRTLEYELTYQADAQAPNTGRVLQGVPGSVDLTGKTSLSRDLTLGTCSSGKCRYDKNIDEVTLTLRFRDEAGKLVGKFGSSVELVSKEKDLASTDGLFSFTLDKIPTGFIVVMSTIGLSDKSVPGEVVSGPYGVFASTNVPQTGSVTLKKGTVYMWNNSKWSVVSGKTSIPGVFVGIE